MKKLLLFLVVFSSVSAFAEYTPQRFPMKCVADTLEVYHDDGAIKGVFFMDKLFYLVSITSTDDHSRTVIITHNMSDRLEIEYNAVAKKNSYSIADGYVKYSLNGVRGIIEDCYIDKTAREPL
jgi:hypothetical protein